MHAKKNLCAMIPADLHAKVIAEKEQLALSTLGEYVELVLKEHFEGGKTIMAATKTLAFQISEELDQRLKNFIAAEKKRGRKISQKEFVIGLIEQALAEYEAQQKLFCANISYTLNRHSKYETTEREQTGTLSAVPACF